MITKKVAIIAAISAMLLGSTAYAAELNADGSVKAGANVTGNATTGNNNAAAEANANGEVDAAGTAKTTTDSNRCADGSKAADGKRCADGAAASNTNADASGTENFGQVISSIQSSRQGAAKVQTMTDVSQVKVVKVSAMAQGENMTALETPLPRTTPTSPRCTRPFRQTPASPPMSKRPFRPRRLT